MWCFKVVDKLNKEGDYINNTTFFNKKKSFKIIINEGLSTSKQYTIMEYFIFNSDIEILYNGTKEECLEVLKKWKTEFEITEKLVLPENIKNIPVEERVELYNNNTTEERELFFIVGSRRGNYSQHWAWNKDQYDTPFIFKTQRIRKLFIENNEEEMINWFKNNSTYQ